MRRQRGEIIHPRFRSLDPPACGAPFYQAGRSKRRRFDWTGVNIRSSASRDMISTVWRSMDSGHHESKAWPIAGCHKRCCNASCGLDLTFFPSPCNLRMVISVSSPSAETRNGVPCSGGARALKIMRHQLLFELHSLSTFGLHLLFGMPFSFYDPIVRVTVRWIVETLNHLACTVG